MTWRPALLVLLSLSVACGSSAPAAPPTSTFLLTPGPYRLSFGGTDCFEITGGQPSRPNSTAVELSVLLTASAGGFALTSESHALSGALASDGSTMTGTVAGTALVGPLLFRTGERDEDPIVLGGAAREGDRFEGQVTAGRPRFSVTDAGGSATAICTGATFVLRRG
jgi:hypothetical protein